MKKISLFALAVSISAAVFAQGTTPQLRTPMETKTRFGIRGGISVSDMKGKDLPSGAMLTEAESKTSFNGGFFVNIPLSKSFRFQPEVNYSSQGGKLRGPSGTSTTSFEQDLDYVNIPLNFQLMTNGGFFVQTGPQVGFLVGAETSNTSGGNKDDFDKLDLAWTAGVGYLSRIGLGIDARYNYGIANTVADDATGMLKGGTWKNNVAQVSLIYHFGAAK